MFRRLVFGILIVLGGILLLGFPNVGVWFGHFLSPRRSVQDAPLAAIALENTALKSRIASYLDMARRLPPPGGEYQEMPVYATYPFNYVSELTIELRGAPDIAENSIAVIYAEKAGAAPGNNLPILIGKVHGVRKGTAAIQTIFDTHFKLAVRVGERGVQALLIGGSVPLVTLIARNALVARGDAIYAAGAGFPHAMAIGEVEKITSVSGAAFQEAAIAVPYEIGELASVFIKK